MPTVGFDHALRVAKAIWDELTGDGGAPIDVAAAMGIQPSGGSWRSLCGAAIAYGLTEGGYNATEIKLPPLGRRCVAPEEEGDDHAAKVEAFLKPALIHAFFSKYGGRKFPTKPIGPNVITSLGYPKERSEAAFNMLLEEGTNLGIIQEIRGENFANLRARKSPNPAEENILVDGGTAEVGESDDGAALVHDEGREVLSRLDPEPIQPSSDVKRVFITHGRDKSILSQIEEIVWAV